MRIILGIGNIGDRYRNTRHNVGFMFLDYLASKYSISFLPSRNDYYFANHIIGENHFTLLKPSNFVNNSGFSVVQALSHFKVSTDDLLVIHDDVYLELGSLRVRMSGGDGGHKGVASIIYHLSLQDFSRIRIGVGEESFVKSDLVDYVLSDFRKNDMQLLDGVFEKCRILAESFIVGAKKQLLDVNSRIIS